MELFSDVMWSDYFIAMGILFAVYLLMRVSVVPAVLALKPPPYAPVQFDGKGIDATGLFDRIEQVRNGFTESKARNHSRAIKRALLVDSKRDEMRKLAFFQNSVQSPSEPPPQHDHGLPLLLA